MTSGIPKTLAQQIYRRDNYACALCGNPTRLCIHHIIPRGEGGKNHEHNLIVLCVQCHADAHNAQEPLVQDEAEYAITEYAITEYMADFYAKRGILWTPWLKPGQEPTLLVDLDDMA